jgi:hypothetical protein
MSSRTKRDRTIVEIIEMGKQAIGDLICDLKKVAPSKRDPKWHARALADATLAALAIAKEERLALEWMERRQLDKATLSQLLREHLGAMPKAELGRLLNDVENKGKAVS